MPIEEDEVSNLWQKLWKNLWVRLFRVAWAIGIILVCIVGVEAAVLVCLVTVGENQKAQIENQQAIAAAVTKAQTAMLEEESKVAQSVENGQKTMQEMLIEARASSAAAREAAADAAGAVEVAKASVAASATTAAQNASIAEKAVQRRPVDVRTIVERRVTPPSESDRSKKLDEKNTKADVTQKKLDTLVKQYKRAIKGEHP